MKRCSLKIEEYWASHCWRLEKMMRFVTLHWSCFSFHHNPRPSQLRSLAHHLNIPIMLPMCLPHLQLQLRTGVLLHQHGPRRRRLRKAVQVAAAVDERRRRLGLLLLAGAVGLLRPLGGLIASESGLRGGDLVLDLPVGRGLGDDVLEKLEVVCVLDRVGCIAGG